MNSQAFRALKPTTYAVCALAAMISMIHAEPVYAQIGSKKSAKAADDRVVADARVRGALEQAGDGGGGGSRRPDFSMATAAPGGGD